MLAQFKRSKASENVNENVWDFFTNQAKTKSNLKLRHISCPQYKWFVIFVNNKVLDAVLYRE